MLTKQQEQKLTAMISEDIQGEERRAAYAVITGYREGKSVKQIVSYYSLDEKLVTDWWTRFSLSEPTATTTGKRGRKSKNIISYVESNIGKTVTPKQVAEEAGISLPTFYNFFNANRGYFKKIKRGEFEIINPNTERNA